MEIKTDIEIREEFNSLKDIENYANEVVNSIYKFDDIAYTFGNAISFKGFDRAIKRFGQATKNRKTKEIYFTLSKKVCLLNLDKGDIICDVILHEMAHCIEYYLFGTSNHGERWKHIAKQIGCSAKVKQSSHQLIIPMSYRAVCKTCNKAHWEMKKPLLQSSCGYCSNSFNEHYLLEYEKVDYKKLVNEKI